MKTDIALSCSPLPRGGVKVSLGAPGVDMSLPLDRAAALKTAASILWQAGVREARFDSGTLTVVAEQR